MYQGSCLSGAVVYQLHGEPRRVSHCYVALTVATLDTPIQLTDIPHICTESKSSWCPC